MNSMDPRFLLNNFPEEEKETFVPDSLYYHSDFTDVISIKKVVGKRTQVKYGEDTFFIPSSLIKKVDGCIYIHTETFKRILEENTGNSTLLVSNNSPSISNEDLLEEIKQLKDSIKILTKTFNDFLQK